MELFTKILRDGLTSLYQPFWFALLLAILFMLVWTDYGSVREAAEKWIGMFKSELLEIVLTQLS